MDFHLPSFSRRETGITRPLLFSHSEVVIDRLNMYKELTPQSMDQYHWFTHIEFNETGDHIFTSLGRRYIDFRNWETDTIKTQLDSEIDNILDFKILPSTNESQFVIAGMSGEVRHGMVTDDGHMVTRLIDSHVGAATNLSVQPCCPYVFYSIGRDGEVIEHDLRAGESTTLFYSSQEATVAMNLRAAPFPQSFYPLISVHPLHTQYFAVGGFNDTVLLYDVRMNRRHASLIYPDLSMCVASYTPPLTPPYEQPLSYPNVPDKCVRSLSYSNIGELLVSYSGGGGDQLISLFQMYRGFGIQAVPPHALAVTPTSTYAQHRGSSTTRGAAFFGHDDQYVVSGSTCGNIYIWKKRGSRLVFRKPGDQEHVTVVRPYSQQYLIATFGNEGFIRIWAPVSDDVALAPPDNSDTVRIWRESPKRRAEELAKEKARRRRRSIIDEWEDDMESLPRRPRRRRFVISDSDDDAEVNVVNEEVNAVDEEVNVVDEEVKEDGGAFWGEIAGNYWDYEEEVEEEDNNED